LGRDIAVLFPGGGQQAALLAHEIAQDDPQSMRAPVEGRILRQDGNYADVRFSVGRLLHAGTSLGVMTMEDVTAMKQAEAQLRNAEKLDAVSRLSAGVAHGFNNLLTIITGYGHLLQDSLGSGNEQDYIDEISRAAGAGALLTAKLLAFGSRCVGEVEPLDIVSLAGETAAAVRAEMPAGLHVITEPAVAPLLVLADRNQLTRALRELLANAREAMPRGGRIRIRAANLETLGECAVQERDLRPGRYVFLKVEDEGEGMDPEAQKHLFEPFYSTKGVGRGTGLATVYGTVRQWGGGVKVISQGGRGTVVTLFLPAA
jgi:two-component system cell cycle sensor histidine kinase/response regulator CckA